jgi:hypothetical protein
MLLSRAKQMKLVEGVDYEMPEDMGAIPEERQFCFVLPSRRQGLLPRILQKLLGQRAKTNAQLKMEKVSLGCTNFVLTRKRIPSKRPFSTGASLPLKSRQTACTDSLLPLSCP